MRDSPVDREVLRSGNLSMQCRGSFNPLPVTISCWTPLRVPFLANNHQCTQDLSWNDMILTIGGITASCPLETADNLAVTLEMYE